MSIIHKPLHPNIRCYDVTITSGNVLVYFFMDRRAKMRNPYQNFHCPLHMFFSSLVSARMLPRRQFLFVHALLGQRMRPGLFPLPQNDQTWTLSKLQ